MSKENCNTLDEDGVPLRFKTVSTLFFAVAAVMVAVLAVAEDEPAGSTDPQGI